jgi:hypothetical protein
MEAGAGENDKPVFVLTGSVARWGIEQLLGRKVHPFFPAYLEIRRATDAESGRVVQPEWGNVSRYLEVPGGPPNKPYFRPFWNQSRNAGQDWLNQNIAGSYSPSSIREVQRRVIEIEGSGYSLKDGHAQLALENFLYGEALPAYPLALFYYRNFGFTTDGPALPPDGLVDVFMEDFGFLDSKGREEFAGLFSADIPDRTDWFEPWEPSSSVVTEIEDEEA